MTNYPDFQFLLHDQLGLCATVPVGPDAHNYETTRSTSDWHAAGVITAVDKENITFELCNETRCGDMITFILLHTMDSVSLHLPELINAKNGERVEKMAAGMGNSILISRACTISPSE